MVSTLSAQSPEKQHINLMHYYYYNRIKYKPIWIWFILHSQYWTQKHSKQLLSWHRLNVLKMLLGVLTLLWMALLLIHGFLLIKPVSIFSICLTVVPGVKLYRWVCLPWVSILNVTGLESIVSILLSCWPQSPLGWNVSPSCGDLNTAEPFSGNVSLIKHPVALYCYDISSSCCAFWVRMRFLKIVPPVGRIVQTRRALRIYPHERRTGPRRDRVSATPTRVESFIRPQMMCLIIDGRTRRDP